MRIAETALNPDGLAVRKRRDVAGSMRRLPCPNAAGSVISSRGAGDRGAAARRVSWPENRSSADPGSHAKIMSGRADDVAVVPADAYEYRHLLEVAQP